MSKDAVKAITLTSFDTTGASGTLQQMNAGGLPEACTLLYIVNDSDIDVLISFDGVNNHFYLRTGVTQEFPAQTNNQPQNKRQMFAKGMGVWVASSSGAAGTGSIHLSGLYTDPS